MPNDFGDDSGEKLIDWMKEILEEQGEEALQNCAKRLSNFLQKARGSLEAGTLEESTEEGALTESAPEARWVRLSMQDIEDIPAYDNIKQIIDAHLDNAGVRHEFANIESHDYLVFQAGDAPTVAESFSNMEKSVSASLNCALSREAKTQTKSYRDMPLSERAQAAREASRAYEESRDKSRERVVEQSKNKCQTKSR